MHITYDPTKQRFINSFIPNHACKELAPTAHRTQPFSSISFHPPTNHKPPLALSITELKPLSREFITEIPTTCCFVGPCTLEHSSIRVPGSQLPYSRPINSPGEDIERHFPKS
ncbi:hypothetical protein CDAR_232451 [Caerostris darwini]|uniref:Uncharacterized protein n=1 Tax=Caerostris darwini TaxID=1538125 RepID=A0AAV4W862_9ARAC|nr:hypothetical protein CDAR_232451 [Caerostris darwini]